MILPIITHPHPSILQQHTDVVDVSILKDTETIAFLSSLCDTMHQAKGIGIAAPQVGTLQQMCVIHKDAIPQHITSEKGVIDPTKDLLLINPSWKKVSYKHNWDTEGCLSIPKVYGKVKRSTHIEVEAIDLQGNILSFRASHFFARVIQHEVDHLHGILFIEKAKDIYTTEDT